MIIIMSILGVFFLIIAIIGRCCQKLKRKKRNKKDVDPDPGSGDPMVDPTALPVQTFVVADPGANTLVTTTATYVVPAGPSPYDPSHAYPPAPGVPTGPSPYNPSQAYPPAPGGIPMQPMPYVPPTYDQSQEQIATMPQPTPQPTEQANAEATAIGQ